MPIKIVFLGGVGTVTGSKYLLEAEGKRILVDCGLFQGFKQLRLRNRAPLPIDPAIIDTVILTHAHLDHSGYVPLLVRNGFFGDVISTQATRDLCELLLLDSGHLLEKDAEYANRHGFSKHRPALPLYTQDDARMSLERFMPWPFHEEHRIADEIGVRLFPAGHILGAAMVRLDIGGTSIVFSGDLGRSRSATMLEPTVVKTADYLIVESTYGNRRHQPGDPEDALAEIINRTAGRGGTVIIPAFAVGRTQSLLYHLRQLKERKRIPDLPVFLDSPMAVNASQTFCDHLADHRLTAAQCRAACNVAHYVRDVEESKSLDHNQVPKVVISASGMATGGRVLHHLKYFAPDRRNTILFTGFQAGGTRGAAMVSGAESVKIHGQYIPVNAEVQNLDMLSAHADSDEILEWLRKFDSPPKTTFITHGEPSASDALRHRIEEELGWSCQVPEHEEEVALQ